TSRTAAASTCSPGSSLPLGSDQSSYLGLWTEATSVPAPPGRGRHSAAPAACTATSFDDGGASGLLRPLLSATAASSGTGAPARAGGSADCPGRSPVRVQPCALPP